MKFNKLFLFVLFLLVLCSFVFSAQVVNNFETALLYIEYPKIEIYYFNEDLQFNFHVYNSTGFELDNVSTSCIFHLYDQTGKHTLKEISQYYQGDFYINISKNNFNIGEYSYVMQCESNLEAGFVSEKFMINQKKYDEKSNFNFILIVVSISIILLLISFNIDKTHLILKLGIIIIVLFMLISIAAIGMTGTGSTGVGFYKIYSRTVWVILAWFIVYFTWIVVLKPIAEKKGWIKRKDK